MLLGVNGHSLLMWPRSNPITPAVLAGGDLYRIHGFSAFHIPPRCCQDDGLNHLCAGEGAEEQSLDSRSEDRAFSLIVSCVY